MNDIENTTFLIIHKSIVEFKNEQDDYEEYRNNFRSVLNSKLGRIDSVLTKISLISNDKINKSKLNKIDLLIIDDDIPTLCDIIEQAIKSQIPKQIIACDSISSVNKLIENNIIDSPLIISLDFKLSKNRDSESTEIKDTIDLYKKIKNTWTSFIIGFTNWEGKEVVTKLEKLIRSNKDSVYDKFKFMNLFSYILKNEYEIIKNNQEIIIELKKVKSENEELKKLLDINSYKPSNEFNKIKSHKIIGNSEEMNFIRQFIEIYAKTDEYLLIRGDSGTGKELVANHIHELSSRKDGPFVTINCAAIPDTLIETELFGYSQGAFTGANKDGKKGLFEQANHGTLFLDEIGDLSLSAQAKILRILQEKEIMKVGSTETSKLDIRVIGATNKDLLKLIEEDKFRSDLYFRFSSLFPKLPPLKDRIIDIKDLINHYSKNNNLWKDSIINELKQYSWPGNVREFIRFISQIELLAQTYKSLTKEKIISFLNIWQKNNPINEYIKSFPTELYRQDEVSLDKKRLNQAIEWLKSLELSVIKCLESNEDINQENLTKYFFSPDGENIKSRNRISQLFHKDYPREIKYLLKEEKAKNDYPFILKSIDNIAKGFKKQLIDDKI